MPLHSRLLGVVLGAILPFVPVSSHAIQDEIQVYTDEINEPGEYGLETHINTTPRGRKTPDYPGDVAPYRGLRLTPEFSRGLTRTLEAGLYLPTTTDAEGKFYAGSYKVRLKWLPIKGDAENGGWYFGTNHELAWMRKEYSDSRREYELRVIGGYRAREWLLGVNAILGWGLTPGYGGSPEATVAWKAVHDVAPGIALGAELYQDLGTLANRLPRELQGRTLFMIMELERKGWGLNFGVGHGLTQASDNWTLKAIVEVPFN